MKRIGKLSAAGVAAILGAALVCPEAWGSPFERPPGSTVHPWQTPYPYQRNVDWDFSTDPRTSPPQYHGLDDDALRGSDRVTFEGPVEWFATADVPGKGTYNGVVGIDNVDGTETLTGTVTFHIDNWERLRPLKHVWTEIYTLEPMPYFEAVDVPPGYAFGSGTSIPPPLKANEDPDPELWLETYWDELMPNPPWEELVFRLEASPGQFALVDRLHVATECVGPVIPEPLTAGLLATGYVVLAGYVRRRRRA